MPPLLCLLSSPRPSMWTYGGSGSWLGTWALWPDILGGLNSSSATDHDLQAKQLNPPSAASSSGDETSYPSKGCEVRRIEYIPKYLAHYQLQKKRTVK